MVSTISLARAAWVPDDPERDREAAAGLAVAWVRQQCAEQQSSGILMLKAFGVERQIPSLRSFAAEHTVITPGAPRSRGWRSGPVLAYAPDGTTLELAARLARGSSLAAVESAHRFPLRGWAHQLGAVDLSRPDERPEGLRPELAEAVDRLDLCTTNGFDDPFGKQQAQRILRTLQGAGVLDRDVILGALAARGVSERAVRHLAKLINELDPQ
ncbi:hypothetical protein ACFV4M_22285 [Kitasatospora indigofera]|uniref:hypothetical protein n=1 Tax=Kitasatospora indigofera TaxID=67307 RepID=UPI00364F176D